MLLRLSLTCAGFVCVYISLFSLNMFICHTQDKRIRYKLFNLSCRLRYLHAIHTFPFLMGALSFWLSFSVELTFIVRYFKRISIKDFHLCKISFIFICMTITLLV